jgi:uncharacterized membrane protein YgaE (UPF0421/DUF939 family)
MSVRSAQNQGTVPIAVGVLGILVLVTGWLILQGMSFLLGCVVIGGLAACAIALLVPPRPR